MPEMALRVTLGAGPADLLKAAILEGIIVALPSGAVGACLTVVGVSIFRRAAPAGMFPRMDQVGVDPRVLFFVVLAALLAAGIACAVPVATLPHRDPAAALSQHSGGRPAAFRGGKRRPFGRVLVAAQGALATVLLVAAALMGRSIWMLSKVRTGFSPKSLLQGTVVRPRGVINNAAAWNPRRNFELWHELIRRINAVPGVASAALAAPGTYGQDVPCLFSVPGSLMSDASGMADAQYLNVTPRYFRTLGIPILYGRPFRDSDSLGSQGVAIVNRTLVRLYFGGADPLGREIILAHGREARRHQLEIVGVVPDINIAGAGPLAQPQIYTTLLQTPVPAVGLLARVGDRYAQTIPALRAAVSSVSSNLQLEKVAPLPEIIFRTLFARPRFLLLLLSVFGILALLLVFAGVYAVASLAARHNVRETAIRLALGARRRDVLGPILREAAYTGLWGVAGGILVSVSLDRFVRAWVFGVQPTDAIALATAGGIVLLANILAGCIPALAALRLRPAEALRIE